MPELERDGGWHLDKRLSVGHIITTLTVAAAVIAFSFQIQTKIDLNTQRINENKEDIAQLRGSMNSQYIEIIRRLERLDAKIDSIARDKVDKE